MMAAFGIEVAGAVIAVLLQAIVAPYLAIGSALPNLALAFALAYAVASRRTNVVLMPFLVGLAYDLLGSGPVGGMALLALLAAIGAQMLTARFGNDTFFMPVASLIIMLLVANLLYAVVCITCGSDVGLGEALLYRSLPAWAYDTVAALVIYPLIRFLLRPKPQELDLTSIS